MAKADKLTVAVIQARPEFLDLNATVEKACALCARRVGPGAAPEACPHSRGEDGVGPGGRK